MFKFNNSIVPNRVRIGWHFSSNKYAYRDAYSALKSSAATILFMFTLSEHNNQGKGFDYILIEMKLQIYDNNYLSLHCHPYLVKLNKITF